MTKWHAHVAHMAKHMNMVGARAPCPPLNPALMLQLFIPLQKYQLVAVLLCSKKVFTNHRRSMMYSRKDPLVQLASGF